MPLEKIKILKHQLSYNPLYHNGLIEISDNDSQLTFLLCQAY